MMMLNVTTTRLHGVASSSRPAARTPAAAAAPARRLWSAPRMRRLAARPASAASPGNDETIYVSAETVEDDAATTPGQRLAAGAEGAADAAAGQVADAASAAAAGVGDAAEAASDAAQRGAAAAADTAAGVADALSDAADVAAAALDAAASTAAAVASDAGDVASALAGDVAAALSAASPQADQQQPQPQPGSAPDERLQGKTVLVVGATGGVGRAVVAALRAKGANVRALVRDAARAATALPPPTPPGHAADGVPSLELVRGDVYQFSTLPAAVRGVDFVVVAAGANDRANPLAPFETEFAGTENLVAAVKQAAAAAGGKGVRRYVLVTSIDVDSPLSPLNLYWGIMFWKKRAEEVLQRSGIPYTVVRPGGLTNKAAAGALVMERAGTFGFPPFKESGSVPRALVADVCVEALVNADAEGKVVEVITKKSAPARPLAELFAGVAP